MGGVNILDFLFLTYCHVLHMELHTVFKEFKNLDPLWRYGIANLAGFGNYIWGKYRETYVRKKAKITLFLNTSFNNFFKNQDFDLNISPDVQLKIRKIRTLPDFWILPSLRNYCTIFSKIAQIEETTSLWKRACWKRVDKMLLLKDIFRGKKWLKYVSHISDVVFMIDLFLCPLRILRASPNRCISFYVSWCLPHPLFIIF